MDKIHAQTLRDVMKKSIEREKSTSEKIESIRLIAESEMKKLDKRVFLKTEWRGSGEIKARDLVEFVYKKAGFPKEFVSRKTEYITHRYAIMYYLVRHRGMKLKNTGSIFGGIDHSTVLHGVNKFKGWIDVNDGEARDILQKVIRAANEFEDVEKLG